MLVKYVGPDTGTQVIPEAGVVCSPGEQVEVPDDIAARLPATWVPVKKSARAATEETD